MIDNEDGLRDLVAKSVNFKDVLLALGLEPTPTNYRKLHVRLKRFSISVAHFEPRSGKTSTWSIDRLEPIVAASTSYTDALRRLNLRTEGSNVYTLKKYIKIYELSTTHFVGRVLGQADPRETPHAEMFCEHSKCQRSSVKKRILRDRLIPYVCCGCGNTGHWNNKPLVLQLEHKNGVGNDNRLENLEFLCPNCHTQTTTFAGRNKTRE